MTDSYRGPERTLNLKLHKRTARNGEFLTPPPSPWASSSDEGLRWGRYSQGIIIEHVYLLLS